VAVGESNASVDTRPERDVTLLASKTLEFTGEPTPVSFGDPAGQPNVLPRAVELTGGRLRCGEIEQDIDSLLGETHRFNPGGAVG